MQPVNKQIQSNIIQALQWSEQEYANFIYETGIAYLEHYIPEDEHGIALLSRSRVYWSWWKNHWAQRDAQFLWLFSEECSHSKVLEKMYYGFHDVYTLVNEIYPNATILSESYAAMIGIFHDQKTEA